MTTKRHQENLAVAGDGVAFAELKRVRPEPGPVVDSVARRKSHGVTQHDHDIDRSESGDALKRAVDRANEKRGQEG